MDSRGETRIPARYAEAAGFAANGLPKVRIRKRGDFIDTAGELRIGPGFDDVSGFSYAGLAIFLHTNGKWAPSMPRAIRSLIRSMTR